MAAKTLYAWSNLRTPKGTKRPGTKVTAESLGLREDQFQEMLDSGSVRAVPYPESKALRGDSPTEHFKKLLKAQNTTDLAAALVEEPEPSK